MSDEEEIGGVCPRCNEEECNCGIGSLDSNDPASDDEVPNDLKRQHAMIDLCGDEDEEGEMVSLDQAILTHYREYREACQAILRCEESYQAIVQALWPTEVREPASGPGPVLLQHQYLPRSPGSDSGLQDLRQLPGPSANGGKAPRQEGRGKKVKGNPKGM